MMIQKQTFLKALISLSLLSIALTLLWWQQQDHTSSQPIALTQGTRLPTPLSIPEFNFKNTSGAPITKDSLKDQWTFLFFGYSYCPDICPTTLRNLNQIFEQIPEGSAQMLFVSADPRRDTPERLAQYLEGFNPHFMGVLGEHREVVSLAKSLNLYLSNADSPDDAWIDHSSTILLVNPQAQVSAIFSGNAQAEAVADDFKSLALSS